MRSLFLIAALGLAGCSQPTQHGEGVAPTESVEPALAPVTLPQTDAAGNRLEALTQNELLWCTSDRVWCVETAADSPGAVHFNNQAIMLTAQGAVWPQIVRIGADEALVGVILTDHQMYSGGDGRADHLQLYRVVRGDATEAVLMPFAADSMIRACFSEADEQTRAGACHDQYKFVTRISLDETVASGAPRIVLETAAASFPGRVTRGADSTQAPPLTHADLVWAADTTCSYRRVFTAAPNGAYAPDQPLPACADYLEP